MAYNVISCQKVAENTQILKIAKFAISDEAVSDQGPVWVQREGISQDP